MSWKSLRFFNKSVINNHFNFTRVIQQNVRTATNISVSRSQKERDTFQEVLPGILDSLANNKKFSRVPHCGAWLKKVLEYNLTGGKNNRGMTTVLSYKMLEKPEKITDETMRSARVLGWCVEMLQSYLLVVDDIMDGSTTRRGVPCWYRLPEVGVGALNDSILMLCSIHELLRKEFSDKPYYMRIFDLFNDALMYTSVGQHLDYMMAHRNKNDYSLFTDEQYRDIVMYKTAYYTYQLPVSLGLCMTNNTDTEAYDTVEKLCLKIGEFFQIQDDFLDCYGDESLTGKAGTDIQEGKCSWLAVTALKRCSSAQRVVFESCYGSKEPAHVERIKRLYDQLELNKLYRENESRTYDDIMRKVHELPPELSPALFSRLIDTINKRKV